jgi:hypothetical protein
MALFPQVTVIYAEKMIIRFFMYRIVKIYDHNIDPWYRKISQFGIFYKKNWHLLKGLS